jgi:protoporphyrinogen oxidase
MAGWAGMDARNGIQQGIFRKTKASAYPSTLFSGLKQQTLSVDSVHFGGLSLKKRVEAHYPVVVVGGGAAGITAMYELAQHQKIPAVLMEVEGRLGGNTQSGRSPKGIQHPTGATIFLPGSEHHQALWKELGLSNPPEQVLGPEIFVMNGERFTAFQNGAPHTPMPPKSKTAKRAVEGLQRFLRDLKRWADKGEAPTTPIQQASKKLLNRWDGMSLADLLKRYERGVKKLIEPFIQSDLAAQSTDVSAYVGMLDLQDLIHPRLIRPGGNAFVLDKMTQAVRGSGLYQAGEPFRTHHRVERVEQDRDRAYVIFRDEAGARRVVSADRVLMAAPYSLVPKLMELPSETVQLMSGLPRSSYSIVSVFMKNTPLNTYQFYVLPNSKTISDLVMTPKDPGADRGPGECPSVMTVYTPHTGRKRNLEAFGEKVIKEVLETFPEIERKNIEGVRVTQFKHAMSAPKPGQVKKLAVMEKTYGRVTLIHSDGGGVPSILSAIDEAQAGVSVVEKAKEKQPA